MAEGNPFTRVAFRPDLPFGFSLRWNEWKGLNGAGSPPISLVTRLGVVPCVQFTKASYCNVMHRSDWGTIGFGAACQWLRQSLSGLPESSMLPDYYHRYHRAEA